MAVLKLDVKGLDKTIKNFEDKVKKYPQEIQNELAAWALETATDAKVLAPKDEGHLAGSIHPEIGKMEAAVTVAVNYAAYVEFGTRKFAASYVNSLPPDWSSFAARFKGGGGGSFAEFIRNIMRWVKSHGIDEKAAYPIALKILKDGIKPQPFLYPAVTKNNQELKKRISELFK